MKVIHLVPARQKGHVHADAPCDCHPTQTVEASPGTQPVVTLTHHPLPKRSA